MTKGRILAVDYGLKRIGLALSDPLQVIASPLDNLEGFKDPVASLILFLQELAKKGKEVKEIVIGLPLHLDGSHSERSQQVRAFCEKLKEQTSIPIQLFDERLTSVQADRSLREGGFTRKKRAEVVDRISAVILLQTYLSGKAIEHDRLHPYLPDSE